MKRLEATLLAHRISRKTSHEEARTLDGSLELPRPGLARQQFPDVHPRAEAVAVQIFVQPRGQWLILRTVGDEDLGQRPRHAAESAPCVRVEDAQAEIGRAHV